MASTYDVIDDPLKEWIGHQHVFFVATAPLAASGHVNVSPKGGDTLRVLGPREVAYLDGSGSGIETISHVRENGRIVIMLCAFDGSPRIVRFHGRGEIIDAGDDRFTQYLGRFSRYPTARSVVRVDVDRISDSCGYGVPFMDFVGDRRETANYVAKAPDRAIRDYLQKHNRASIDGIPALAPEIIDRVVIQRP